MSWPATLDQAVGRRDDPGQHPHRGRLAGAVAPEQRGGRAGVDREARSRGRRRPGRTGRRATGRRRRGQAHVGPIAGRAPCRIPVRSAARVGWLASGHGAWSCTTCAPVGSRPARRRDAGRRRAAVSGSSKRSPFSAFSTRLAGGSKRSPYVAASSWARATKAVMPVPVRALVAVDELRRAAGDGREADAEDRADVGLGGRADHALVEAADGLHGLDERASGP